MTTTLSPSAIISRAFEIYRTQVGTLLAGAALIYLAQFVVNLVLPDSLDWIGSIVSLVLTAFFTGMVVMLVRDLQDGHRDSSLGELFSSVTPVFVPVIVVSILFGIGVAIGFVLIIIPGLILLTIWSVAIPVTVIERPGIFAAFGRSRQIVKGNGWQVFGTILPRLAHRDRRRGARRPARERVRRRHRGAHRGHHQRADRSRDRADRRAHLLRSRGRKAAGGAGRVDDVGSGASGGDLDPPPSAV